MKRLNVYSLNVEWEHVGLKKKTCSIARLCAFDLIAVVLTKHFVKTVTFAMRIAVLLLKTAADLQSGMPMRLPPNRPGRRARRPDRPLPTDLCCRQRLAERDGRRQRTAKREGGA